MSYFPHHEDAKYQAEHSYMAQIGKTIEPVMKPCGFDWRQSVALLSGVFAKEVVASTMTVVYATSSDEAGRAKTNERIASLIDPSAFAFTLDDGTEAMIFPFFNQEETEEVMDKVVETLRTEQPGNELKLGYASRSGRVIDSDILIGEAKA